MSITYHTPRSMVLLSLEAQWPMETRKGAIDNFLNVHSDIRRRHYPLPLPPPLLIAANREHLMATSLYYWLTIRVRRHMSVFLQKQTEPPITIHNQRNVQVL